MEKRTEIFLLTHSHWGDALKEAAETIVGPIRNCKQFALMPEDALVDYIGKIEQCIEGEEQILMLTDLLGGTSSNVAAIFCQKNNNVMALSGLSMEMLIAADELRDEYAGEELIIKILDQVVENSQNLKKNGRD